MTDNYNHTYVDFEIKSKKDVEAYLPTTFRVGSTEYVNLDIASLLTTVSSLNVYKYDINTEATLSGIFNYYHNDVITDVVCDSLSLAYPLDFFSEFCTASSVVRIFDVHTVFTPNNSIENLTDINTSIVSCVSNTADTDVINTFHIYIGAVNTKYNIPVDLYLCNDKYYNYKTDIFSTMIDLVGLSLDMDVGKGRKGVISVDTFSTNLINSSGTQLNIFSTDIDMKGYELEVATISGQWLMLLEIIIRRHFV